MRSRSAMAARRSISSCAMASRASARARSRWKTVVSPNMGTSSRAGANGASTYGKGMPDANAATTTITITEPMAV